MVTIKDRHYIQRDIVTNLAHKSPLRFSELQPKHIPNNTFSYHLNKLCQADYVRPTEYGYTITRKALKELPYNDNYEKSIARPTALTTVYITNSAGEVLLFKRLTSPFHNWFGIPAGPIHSGETLIQAAQRELYEKTGLSVEASSLRASGVLDFRYLEQNSAKSFIHVISFLYAYTYTGDPEILNGRQSKYGELSWSKLDGSNILPEVYEAQKMVANNKIAVYSTDFKEPS